MPPKRRATPAARAIEDSDAELEITGDIPPVERPNKKAAREPNPEPSQAAQARAPASRSVFKVSDDDTKKICAQIEKYQAEERRKLADGKSLPGAQELEELAGRVVRAMLFKAQEKPGQPVRRQDLLDAIKAGGTSKAARNLPAVVIPMAQARMASVFGLNMKELERDATETAASKKAASHADDATRALEYVLESMLPAEIRREFVDPPNQDAGNGFAGVVMALVYMEGGKVSQDALMELLQQVGVRAGQKHPALGDTLEELKKLEAKRWLVGSKKRGADGGESIWYERGEVGRAHISDVELKAWIEEEFSKGGVEEAQAGAEGGDEEDCIELD